MILFYLIWIIWLSSEIGLNRLVRAGSKDKKNQDKGSIRVIWILIVLAILSGVLFSSYTSIPISSYSFTPYIGLALLLFGIIFRFIAIWSLGSMFTVDVTIREKHALKRDGMYKYIRHPSYSGSLLSFIGFAISLNNWLSLLSVFIFISIGLLNRIKIEERLLEDQFGDQYLDYKKKTYRLIPWIF